MVFLSYKMNNVICIKACSMSALEHAHSAYVLWVGADFADE